VESLWFVRRELAVVKVIQNWRRSYTTLCWSAVVTIALSCTIFVQNIVILKVKLGVIEGHWKWHHLLDRVRVPICVLL